MNIRSLIRIIENNDSKRNRGGAIRPIEKGTETMMTKTKLDEQARQIVRMAEDSGVESNYFFVTTFKRYQVQLGILDELEKAMEENGMQVTKEYVKGRKNLYSNPAIQDYNRTTDSANKTVTTLMRILKNFDIDKGNEQEDPLLKIINGGADDD